MVLVRDVMDKKAAYIIHDATFQQAAALLVASKCISLAVIDEQRNLLGVLAEGDLLQAFIPDVNEIAGSNGSLHDAARLFIENGEHLAKQSIRRLIISNPISLHPDDNLLKAATIMLKKNLKRMPVVENGKYVGSISRSDICWLVACN